MSQNIKNFKIFWELYGYLFCQNSIFYTQVTYTSKYKIKTTWKGFDFVEIVTLIFCIFKIGRKFDPPQPQGGGGREVELFSKFAHF